MNERDILNNLVSCFKSDFESTLESSNVVRQETDSLELEELYSILPAKFPRLYEQLVLTYRWDRSDLGLLRLLANPIGIGLTGLRNEILTDKCLHEVCTKKGFIQFG